MSKKQTKPEAEDIFPGGDALRIGRDINTLLEAREQAARTILANHSVPQRGHSEAFEALTAHKRRLVQDARALLIDIEDLRSAVRAGEWGLALLLAERVGYSAAKASVRRFEPGVLAQRKLDKGRRTTGPERGNASQKEKTAAKRAHYGPQYQKMLVKMIEKDPDIGYTKATDLIGEHFRKFTMGDRFHNGKNVRELTRDPRK